MFINGIDIDMKQNLCKFVGKVKTGLETPLNISLEQQLENVYEIDFSIYARNMEQKIRLRFENISGINAKRLIKKGMNLAVKCEYVPNELKFYVKYFKILDKWVYGANPNQPQIQK